MIQGIDTGTELILGVGGAIVMLAAFWKWAWYGTRSKDVEGSHRPGPLKRFFQTWGDFRDAILGREALTHPDTGKELAPAVPGIGSRMATTEAQLSVLTEAVATLAQSNRRLDSIEDRVQRLEEAEHERMLARTESIEMLRTIETAIQADPHARRRTRDYIDEDNQ